MRVPATVVATLATKQPLADWQPLRPVWAGGNRGQTLRYPHNFAVLRQAPSNASWSVATHSLASPTVANNSSSRWR